MKSILILSLFFASQASAALPRWVVVSEKFECSEVSVEPVRSIEGNVCHREGDITTLIVDLNTEPTCERVTEVKFLCCGSTVACQLPVED